MNQRPRAEKPPKKLTLRLIGQNRDEEAPNHVEISGNNALRRNDVRGEMEIEIDLSDYEFGQGIKVTEVERTRGIVREIATLIVAVLFIILIFWKADVPLAIMLSILGSIVIYFFGKLVSQRP